MLLASEFELPHLSRRLAGVLQSPAEVTALLREQDVPEGVLALSGPEIPARLDVVLRDAAWADYLRPAVRGEVDAILHGTPLDDRSDRQPALRSPHAP